MRKISFFLFLICFFLAKSQTSQINIVNFTVKNTLPAKTDEWLSTPGALLLSAQKSPQVRDLKAILVIQIRSGGAIICGSNTATSRPLDPFDVRTFNTADLLGMLGNCKELKEGNYTICAQFFNSERKEISREVCKDFKVEGKKTDYAPPSLISPENEKNFSIKEFQGFVTFRWTPLVPKPKEPVTYRLKVWQLMQGQNSAQAMRTNQPIVTKDVDNITQAVVNGIYTGPCRPPYLCDFVWAVEAINKDGTSTVSSEPFTFKINEGTGGGITNRFPEDKKTINLDEAKAITFRWTPVVPKPQSAVTYRLKVWQLMQGQTGAQAMRTNKPIVTKDVADITEATVNEVYTGPCRPPYLCDFVWAVDVINRDGSSTGSSEPFTFKVNEGNTTGISNQFPEDKKVLKPDEAKTITFRWTPVVPKPQSAVTYRLKVWQLMQGQNPAQAMRTNKPIVTKDVADITEATVSGIYTGPCKPPYLCDFVWTVQALTREGKPIGNNNGTSEPFLFKMSNDIDIQIDSVSVGCCANGKQSFTIIIKNNLTNTVKITQLKVDKVNGVTTSILPTSLSPVLPVTIAGNGSVTFTGQLNCIDTAKTIRFYVAAEDAADNAITETEVEEATLKCPCDPCRDMQVTVQKDTLVLPKNGNPMQVNLNGMFAGLNPNNIKKITAEIIYFNIQQTKDTNCAKCVYDSKYYGNFTLPASSLPGYNGPVLNKPDYSRLISWTSTVIKECNGQPHDDGGGVGHGDIGKNVTTPKQTQGATFGEKSAIIGGPGNPNPPLPQLPNFILPIAIPEMNSLSCCGDVIKICVRFTFYDFCCHTCEVIKCYEIKREK